jgi:DNA-binding GntR family transcriptional regulator
LKRVGSEKINDNSLAGQVFKALQNDILNGVLAPGDALTEQKLCDELGVSRTPVREALSKLELERLVRTVPNRGAVVVGITEKDIADIYTIRMYIEGLAARWSAENITDAQLGTLRSIVELQEFYAERGDMMQIWQLDTRFHELIYESCSSGVLQVTLSNFHRYIQKARELSIKKPGRAQPSVREHRAILEAVAAHDGALAEKLMTEHIGNAKNNIATL